MTITVQGERYDDARDLHASIIEAEAQLEQMPSETKEHTEFAEHIARLRDALPEGFDPETLAAVNADAPEAQTEAGANAASLTDDEPTNDEPTDDEETPPVCPLCGSVGLLPEQPPQDPTSERCPACFGIGIVFTGSRVEGHESRNCPTCSGNGWVAKEPTIPLPPPAEQASAAPALEGAQWNANTHRWDPPVDATAPWEGATWNGLTGGYQ